MTAKELLQSLVDNAGFQLSQCVEGVDEANADQKLHDDAMSFRVTFAHLIECCHAALEHAEGRDYAWGTFKATSTDFASLVEEWRAIRAKAAEVLMSDDEKLIKLGADYIAGHDYYHVGQLVTLRLSFEPTWNSYAIYGS